MIRYDTLNQHLYTYAHFDIIYMLEIYLLLDPVVKARQNTIGIDFENKLILPLYEMERVGFKADKQYLENSRIPNLKITSYNAGNVHLKWQARSLR